MDVDFVCRLIVSALIVAAVVFWLYVSWIVPEREQREHRRWLQTDEGKAFSARLASARIEATNARLAACAREDQANG